MSNQWHETLYDRYTAEIGLDSKVMRVKAQSEVLFLSKILNLPPKSAVLDLPCGTGRHANLLANLGYNVTGVDINRECLSLARKYCGKLPISFRHGDMRTLSWAHRKFDAVINMFSSFGYFQTDHENEEVLKEMVRCLKPGGKIIIQTINRDFLMTVFDPARWGEEKNHYWQDGTRYDPKTKYVEAQRIIIEKTSNRVHRSYHRMRLYSAAELMSLMRKCGLQQVRVYGDSNGSPFHRLKSTHPFYVGTSH